MDESKFSKYEELVQPKINEKKMVRFSPDKTADKYIGDVLASPKRTTVRFYPLFFLIMLVVSVDRLTYSEAHSKIRQALNK